MRFFRRNQPLREWERGWPLRRALLSLCVSLAALSQPALAQAESQPAVGLSPEALGEALSCRSPAAAGDFASALFLEGKPPVWMHEIKEEEDTEGMIGLYGYKLSHTVSFLGEPVDRVYFIKNWIVTLWPRDKASAFISARKMERAPIKSAEQYFFFSDPESGPMLGAFEPTGNSMSAALAKAFGGEAPPSLPSSSLFVGCNYTATSQAEFLEVARQADDLLDDMIKDIGNLSRTDKSQ